MRKFRAWHEQTKQMVYFDPQKEDQYVFAHFYRLIHTEGNIMMQFTGLVDSKGNDVYESDYLDFSQSEWGESIEFEVVPSVTDLVADWSLHGVAGDVRTWRTVVGNVHEGKA